MKKYKVFHKNDWSADTAMNVFIKMTGHIAETMFNVYSTASTYYYGGTGTSCHSKADTRTNYIYI